MTAPRNLSKRELDYMVRRLMPPQLWEVWRLRADGHTVAEIAKQTNEPTARVEALIKIANLRVAVLRENVEQG